MNFVDVCMMCLGNSDFVREFNKNTGLYFQKVNSLYDIEVFTVFVDYVEESVWKNVKTDC